MLFLMHRGILFAFFWIGVLIRVAVYEIVNENVDVLW